MAGKLQETGRIFANVRIAPGVYRMTVTAAGIAAATRPGQFVHVRTPKHPVQMLRMPFAVYDADTVNGTVDICYQVVGEGTAQLAELAEGDELDLIGPIGNGWNPPEGARHALLIAGGVGAPALNLLARQLAASGVRVDVVMGFRGKENICCVERFEASVAVGGGKIFITTDDGSFGTHGFVTAESDALIASGEYDYVAVCGPTPMMANAVKPALEHGVPCQVSMEKLMACGVGACLSCVVDTSSGKKRCCVDGPVFDASEVVWR